MADVAGLDWGVTYPINFTPTGDLTSTAIHQHIQEIAKMYGHLNYLRGNVDGGATIGIEKFVPTPADLPEGANVGDVYMTNGEFYNLYVWDGNNWVQLNTSSLPIATTTTPGISIRGTLEGYLSDTPSENKHVSEYMLKQATAALAGSGVPSGTVVMWHGVRSNVPAGWAICDGTQGTPNLLGRFVRCVDNLDGTPGATGGNNNFTLTNDNLPSHKHNAKFENIDFRHTHQSPVPRHRHQIVNGDLQASGGSHGHNSVSLSGGEHQNFFSDYLRGGESYPVNVASGSGMSVLGAGSYSIAYNRTAGNDGGHGHSGSAGSGGSTHGHIITGYTQYDSAGGVTITTNQISMNTINVTGETEGQGFSVPFDNRPAYIDMLYIMKL